MKYQCYLKKLLVTSNNISHSSGGFGPFDDKMKKCYHVCVHI